MVKILNEYYYIDVDKFVDAAIIPTVTGDTESISIVKFETLKAMIEVIISQNDPIDETVGLKSNSVPIPFKLAFNTLLKYKILNKNENG